MKKILSVLICLGMLFGCSNNEVKTNKESNIDTKIDEESSVKSKIENNKIYLSNTIKEFEEIEKILMDIGYMYSVETGELSLVNPEFDKCRIIIFSQDKSSSLLLMQIEKSKSFHYIKEYNSDKSVVMGKNDNVKWSFDLNKPLNNTTPTIDDLNDMLNIKLEYNIWGKSYNLSYLELNYFLEIYNDVLINKKNTNIIDIKMKEFPK
ncbi:MAG: hypothetical protein RR623_10325 [Bacilli bacterium]